MKKVFSYQVIEDNAGGISLFVFNPPGECIYYSAGYELNPENLLIDIASLEDGVDPTFWDSYPFDQDKSYQEAYNDLTSWDCGWEIIADETAIYPEKMGLSGRSIFKVKDRD